MPDAKDFPDWGKAILADLRAAQAAGRELESKDFLEVFLRHVPNPSGRPIPSAADVMASLAPYQKDLDRIMAETAASFPDGMANPAFGDELGKRVKAFVDSHPRNAGGASA